jgi:hypothetical protein
MLGATLLFSDGDAMRIFIVFCALCALCWGGNQLYQKKTRFGLLSKFSSPTFTPSEEWEMPPLAFVEQEEVNKILTQKFTYLARGSQAFAFISEDGKYVLKLFKQHKWHPKNIFGYIPLSFNPYFKDYQLRQKKQEMVLSSCRAALLNVKEETGVLYAHLNPTPLQIPEMKLIDKRGKEWVLDLSKSCFLLQKKADLFYPHVEALMAKGDVEGAKYAITSTIALLERFILKGVYENNIILRKNFGFIENEAIQFDIGKFKCDPTRRGDRNEIRISTKNFHLWIERNYPELLSHFDEKLKEVLSNTQTN